MNLKVNRLTTFAVEAPGLTVADFLLFVNRISTIPMTASCRMTDT